ncbi:MAG TPA: hypothetical protein VNB23_07055, partial [Ramlibacter sp.]|nr:hypothetical protein [Ramlibacter sp.]
MHPILRTEDWKAFKDLVRTRFHKPVDEARLEAVCVEAAQLAAGNPSSPYSAPEGCINAAVRSMDRSAEFQTSEEARRERRFVN